MFYSQPKVTVIDPMCGSASTAVAARTLGCDTVCFDLDPVCKVLPQFTCNSNYYIHVLEKPVGSSSYVLPRFTCNSNYYFPFDSFLASIKSAVWNRGTRITASFSVQYSFIIIRRVLCSLHADYEQPGKGSVYCSDDEERRTKEEDGQEANREGLRTGSAPVVKNERKSKVEVSSSSEDEKNASEDEKNSSEDEKKKKKKTKKEKKEKEAKKK